VVTIVGGVTVAQTTVGIRELKARLSTYLKQVKAGASLIVTERGQPIGRIVPIKSSREERLQGLIEAGVMAWSGRKLDPIAPVAQTKDNGTVADLLLEDRE
jgi:prevent-host-death family protein